MLALSCEASAALRGGLSVTLQGKQGEVVQQNTTDGQTSLLLLRLTQDMAEVTMPIATNMLFLAARTIKHTIPNTEPLGIKIKTHTMKPLVELIHITDICSPFITKCDWQQFAKSWHLREKKA